MTSGCQNARAAEWFWIIDDGYLPTGPFLTEEDVRADALDSIENRKRFFCLDCNKDTIDGEYYMVSDELWAASGGGDGMLCLACLERRVGRPLVFEDFTVLRPELCLGVE